MLANYKRCPLTELLKRNVTSSGVVPVSSGQLPVIAPVKLQSLGTSRDFTVAFGPFGWHFILTPRTLLSRSHLGAKSLAFGSWSSNLVPLARHGGPDWAEWPADTSHCDHNQ